jgi:hypothetical protein
MKNSLSLAAQAVLDAFLASNWESTKDRQRLAAALRAAADQVVPYEPLKGCDPQAWERDDIRGELLAIANELEAQ